MPNQTPEGYDRPHEGEEDLWSPYNHKFEGFWRGGIHWSEVLRFDAINFIEHASHQEKPFFMYLAFNAPHDPREAPREFVESYDPDVIELQPDDSIVLIAFFGFGDFRQGIRSSDYI